MKFPLFNKTSGRSRLVAVAVIAVLLALVFELLFANFNLFFHFNGKDQARTLLPYYTGELAREDGSFVITPSNSGAGLLYFKDVPGGISSISFDIRYTDRSTRDTIPAPTVTVTATDPRTTWTSGGFIPVITDSFAVGEGGDFRSLMLYPSIVNDGVGDLKLSFSNLEGVVELRNLQINARPAFAFSVFRFLIVFLLLFVPALLYVQGLFFKNYDPTNKTHRYAAKTVVIFTLLLSLFFVSCFLYGKDSIPYPLEGAVRYYQPYVQQFDAFMKGQLHLDVPVSDELLSLENPYDYLSRIDADPLWDRAFYEGKYYSYFGLTPIFLVYFPYYFITGSLPSDSVVLSIFLFITAIFIPLCVLKWVDLHEKRRLPLSVVYFGAITAFIGSMMLLIARSVTPFYYIATLSASAFLSVFLYLLMKATECTRLRSRVILYALAGISYAAILHSRLNIALLAAFIVIPYLIFRVLKRREPTITPCSSIDAPSEGESPTQATAVLLRIRTFFASPKELFVSLLALGLPVLLGLVALLLLNYLRFGSLFEFGTSYQFTVSDVRYNELSLRDIFPAFYHYFLQNLEFSAFFPFFSIHRSALSDYGHYVYIDANFGLFSLPLFCSLLLSPAVLFLKNRTRYEKSLLLSLSIGLLTVALLDFSLGGVIFRYVADLTVPAALASVFLCFALYSENRPDAVHIPLCDSATYATVSDRYTKKRALTVALLLFFLLSCAVSLLLSLSYNANLTKYATEIFISLKNLFCPG